MIANKIIREASFVKLLITISLSTIFINSCNNDLNNSDISFSTKTEYIPVNSSSIANIDSNMYKEIAPYKSHLDSSMTVQIGYTDSEIFKQQPNGLLNNLSADMLMEEAKLATKNTNHTPDFCLLNYGGLRYSLPNGKITLADVYQMMPFDNELVILKLSGEKVDSIFKYIAFTGGQPIAGCTIEVAKNKYRNAKINGKDFDKSKSYFVLTSDYLASGGDKMNFLQNPLASFDTGLLLRDAMINYIKKESSKGRKIIASNEKRIKLLR